MTDWTTPPTWTTETPTNATTLNKHSQDENYLKEVLDGTHTTKIPSAALSADAIIAIEVFS